MLTLGWSLTLELVSMSMLNGDQDGSKVRLRLASIVVKVDIWTEKSNLNYLFKYSKSVAESSSIVMMVPT